MYPNLEAEMARKGLKKGEVADKIGMAYQTFLDKSLGRTDFKVGEAKKIKRKLFPDHSIEYLFKKKGE